MWLIINYWTLSYRKCPTNKMHFDPVDHFVETPTNHKGVELVHPAFQRTYLQ